MGVNNAIANANVNAVFSKNWYPYGGQVFYFTVAFCNKNLIYFVVK